MPSLYTVNLASCPGLPLGAITLSANSPKCLHLRPGHLTLSFGNRTAPVYIAGFHDSAPVPSVIIADDIRKKLLIPIPLNLNLAVGNQVNLWRLGPLIGIFANRFYKTLKPFGEQTPFFRKLQSAARSLHAVCFAFAPGDIDWVHKIIRGSIPPGPNQESAGWQTISLPFPDVIYDRGLFPQGEPRKEAAAARKILRHYPGLKLFNPAFFGKWKTHRLLSKHEIIYRHLPETRLFASPGDVGELLARYGTVYLKPSGGSSGRGIVQLTLTSQNYIVNQWVAKQVKSLCITEHAELERLLRELAGSRKYIVQQGLRLAKSGGNPFDIRALVQKNNQGRWFCTGMAVRVAGPGSFISNIHAGGRAARISEVLPKVFPAQHAAGKIIHDIRSLCSLIASWVSAEYNPLFGEIAVDLGIDESGKVWIIELNAVPGRSVFRRIGAAEIAAKAVSRPMEYACYLAGFAPELNK